MAGSITGLTIAGVAYSMWKRVADKSRPGSEPSPEVTAAASAVDSLRAAIEECSGKVAAVTFEVAKIPEAAIKSSVVERSRSSSSVPSESTVAFDDRRLPRGGDAGRREVEPGIPEMLSWYRSAPEQFVESAISRVVVRKAGGQVTLEPEAAGRVLVFAVNEGVFAAPHPDLRIDDTAWHDTGIGALFTCDEFSDGNSYASFTMEAPATLERTGESWRLKKQGRLRLVRSAGA